MPGKVLFHKQTLLGISQIYSNVSCSPKQPHLMFGFFEQTMFRRPHSIISGEQLFCYLRLMGGLHFQKRLYFIKIFIRNNSLMAFLDIILRHLPSVMANLGWK